MSKMYTQYDFFLEQLIRTLEDKKRICTRFERNPDGYVLEWDIFQKRVKFHVVFSLRIQNESFFADAIFNFQQISEKNRVFLSRSLHHFVILFKNDPFFRLFFLTKRLDFQSFPSYLIRNVEQYDKIVQEKNVSFLSDALQNIYLHSFYELHKITTEDPYTDYSEGFFVIGKDALFLCRFFEKHKWFTFDSFRASYLPEETYVVRFQFFPEEIRNFSQIDYFYDTFVRGLQNLGFNALFY